jgi:copper(I)-binding protein
MKKKILCSFGIALLLCNASKTFAAETSAANGAPSGSQSSTEQPQKPEATKILEITDIWARKSMSPNNNSAAYMKINNPSQEQITIIGASASMVANNVELHKSFVDEKGISRMTSIDKIVVPAASSIELTPGAIHIMLFDLKKTLSEGDKFDIIIKLEGKDPITVQATVK